MPSFQPQWLHTPSSGDFTSTQSPSWATLLSPSPVCCCSKSTRTGYAWVCLFRLAIPWQPAADLPWTTFPSTVTHIWFCLCGMTISMRACWPYLRQKWAGCYFAASVRPFVTDITTFDIAVSSWTLSAFHKKYFQVCFATRSQDAVSWHRLSFIFLASSRVLSPNDLTMPWSPGSSDAAAHVQS